MGTIGPDDFVTFAEDNELIDALGAFILERACQTAARWGDVAVSVNVSPLQFARPDLVEFIVATAARAQLPLHRLEIEITETSQFGDLAAACMTLEALRQHGVSISLDDLGSGHATTELMQRLPLDRVKLGKAVVDLAATEEGAREVAALIRHALDLGLGVTAEGVETQEQLAFLRTCGCDRIQGFFYARPMSGPELSAFVRLVAG
jgi:EAL domain-containing protein (putative c-di-GMP-specific phosphodiesterase class I)